MGAGGGEGVVGRHRGCMRGLDRRERGLSIEKGCCCTWVVGEAVLVAGRMGGFETLGWVAGLGVSMGARQCCMVVVVVVVGSVGEGLALLEIELFATGFGPR